MNSTNPAWRRALEGALAQHAQIPFCRFVQVATIRLDGRPANRTLTFRFFLSGDRLLFTADTRTEKLKQIANNPWAEACWYFTETRSQFRLLGQLHVIGETDEQELVQARLRTWQERSDQARQSFTWPTPGKPLEQPEAFNKPMPQQPPENFALLVFTVEQVEILDLSCQPHRRTAYGLEDGVWDKENLNP